MKSTSILSLSHEPWFHITPSASRRVDIHSAETSLSLCHRDHFHHVRRHHVDFRHEVRSKKCIIFLGNPHIQKKTKKRTALQTAPPSTRERMNLTSQFDSTFVTTRWYFFFSFPLPPRPPPTPLLSSPSASGQVCLVPRRPLEAAMSLSSPRSSRDLLARGEEPAG